MTADDPKLLSSSNPQIAKGDGDEFVARYIAAMPEWKREIGAWLDGRVQLVYPEAKKAVRWNTPFYLKEDGAFFAFYCYKNYVQLTFFQGAALDPVPPKASKVGNVRYFQIYEKDALDAGLIDAWLRQALSLPGEKLW
jgi:hypothetical protein